MADAASTFTYGYQPGSNLIATIAGPGFPLPLGEGQGEGAKPAVTNHWESDRDVLDFKENKAGATDVSSYDYIVNEIGQRTNVATGGTAFPALPTWIWGYDSLGQVTKADSSVTAFDRAYQYDAIGNRKKSADSLTLPTSDNYTSNSVNQYTAVGAVTPGYDFDGNATAYPLPTAPGANSSLVWDAENRLIETQVAGSGPLVTTLYDAQFRRIAETIGTATTLYIYDGWNCIAEYQLQTSSFNLHTSYTWGLDLSGSFQGAGGVGGMLAETHHSGTPTTYYPTYDGNGNVSEYLDAGGAIIAHFEYDPFGNTVVNTDTSNQFTYRFSTKPLSFATGLYYYGYRYYDPATGRWPSRDQIEERGGLNLYGFVGNSSIQHFDILGLERCKEGAVKWVKFCMIINFGAAKTEACTTNGLEEVWNAMKDKAKEYAEEKLDEEAEGLTVKTFKDAIGKSLQILNNYDKLSVIASSQGTFGLGMKAIFKCCECEEDKTWNWGKQNEETSWFQDDDTGLTYNFADPSSFKNFMTDYSGAVKSLATKIAENCHLTNDE